MLRLAIFDVDGTLVDSQHNIVEAMSMAYGAHGLPQPRPEAVRAIIGLSLVEAVAALLPRHEHSVHLRVALAYKDAFNTLRVRPDHAEPMFPGAIETLARLEADGWLLGVATGKSNRGMRAMIERHGLEGRFVTIQTADDNPGKPHPGMLLRAMAETGADRAATVMIGDTSYDMNMARAAGAAGIGVGWGYHPVEELKAAGAVAVIADYSELPDLARSLAQGSECVSAAS